MLQKISHMGGTTAIVILVVLIAFATIASALQPADKPRPIARRFMTERELAMYRGLKEALPMYRIHAQVAMGALLDAPRRAGQRKHADRNAFSQKM